MHSWIVCARGLGKFRKPWSFSSFAVICLSPQTKEGCFHSAVAVTHLGLQSGWGRTSGFNCFSSSFRRSQKRFYPNLPALLSQMGNTTGFIPWSLCPYPLCFGTEWMLCSTCELWPVEAPHSSAMLWPPSAPTRQIKEAALSSSLAWLPLCQAVSRSLAPLTWPHGSNSD